MRISQLLKVMDKDDEIIIDDGNKCIDRMRVYKGTARGIGKDNPINKMHVVVIYPYDNKLLVLAQYPPNKEEVKCEDRDIKC